MWALLLEAVQPGLATDVVYVAGDRVVTDPLCKPFSMGRNLFCVHRFTTSSARFLLADLSCSVALACPWSWRILRMISPRTVAH